MKQVAAPVTTEVVLAALMTSITVAGCLPLPRWAPLALPEHSTPIVCADPAVLGQEGGGQQTA